jgi:hypothetical protein
MMPRLLIPVGRWKINTEFTAKRANIRLSGLAVSDAWKTDNTVHSVALTLNQAQELVSKLNMTLLELERQRKDNVARASEGSSTLPHSHD